MPKFVSKIVDAYPELKYALLEAQTFDEKHYGFPEIYYKIMETDQLRIDAFRDGFKQYKQLKNKVVCEAGVGRMALTKHYLPYVKKAYLIENNPNITGFIKKELKKNGWDKKVEFIQGDAMKVELPEPVDFIIGEMMSIYCANEYQVQIFKHLRQFLNPEGKLLPEKIINVVELGYAEFETKHKHYPLMFTRHLPELITSQAVVNTIDLYKVKKETVEKTVKLKAYLSGKINCAYLRSLIQIKEGVNFTGTDSLMPPTVLKLNKTYKVNAGDTIKLQAGFAFGSSLDKAKFKIVP